MAMQATAMGITQGTIPREMPPNTEVSSSSARISSTRRRDRKKPFCTPSQVIVNTHTCAIGVPGLLNRWMRKVKRMIHHSGFSERSIIRIGTPDSRISKNVPTVSTA